MRVRQWLWHGPVRLHGRGGEAAPAPFPPDPAIPPGSSRGLPALHRQARVTELRWKEGSHESGRQQFMQTIDSYIADERVGLAKPAKGVELYICPSQGKTAQVLAEHLPKEHSGFLTVTGGVPVIGVFVWRRPHVSTQTPTRHEGSKVQSMPVSRKQQAVIATSVPMSPQLTKPASQFVNPNEHHCLAYDATDDVPPGFGQGVVKDDNDLPVYDCTSISSRSLSPNEAIAIFLPEAAAWAGSFSPNGPSQAAGSQVWRNV